MGSSRRRLAFGRIVLVRDPFDTIYELGQAKVNDKTRLQFLEPQIREALCRVNRIIRSRLAFDNYGIVNKDVNAEGMLRIA